MTALKIKDNSFVLFTITLLLGLLSKSACLWLLITRMKMDRSLKKKLGIKGTSSLLRVSLFWLRERMLSLSTCLFIKQFSL